MRLSDLPEAILAWLVYAGVDFASLVGFIGAHIPIVIAVICGLIIAPAIWRFAVSGKANANSGLRVYSLRTQQHVRTLTVKEFCNELPNAPYDVKAFIKAISEYGAAYRNTSDFAWECHKDALAEVIDETTIRNGITRCTLTDKAQKELEKRPKLLSEVSDEDAKIRAIRGVEGIRPSIFSPNQLVWWYYTDDENASKPFNPYEHIGLPLTK